MSSPFVAEIRIFGFNFPPKGWAFAAGQLLPISQNTALFSLLGTMYGGDGKSTFALPDMQGNVGIGMGQGNGLSQYFEGETGGSENVTLLQSELPSHNHMFNAQTVVGTTLSATNAQLSQAFVGSKTVNYTGNYLSPNSPNITLSPFALSTM